MVLRPPAPPCANIEKPPNKSHSFEERHQELQSRRVEVFQSLNRKDIAKKLLWIAISAALLIALGLLLFPKRVVSVADADQNSETKTGTGNPHIQDDGLIRAANPFSETPHILVPKDQALDILAEAIQEHEGWYPGSIAFDNNNPGNLRSWKTATGTSRGFAVFSSYRAGRAALEDFLLWKCDTHENLIDLMNMYAPPSDGNDSYGYARLLAQRLGVTMRMPLSEIYCD